MSASASKSADTSKTDQPSSSEPQQAQQSQLGALEEDDEFEEFPAQGTPPRLFYRNRLLLTKFELVV